MSFTVIQPFAGEATGFLDHRITLESRARGLPKRSWIKISQIRTLASVERIGRRLARSSLEEVARVVDGLGEIIG